VKGFFYRIQHDHGYCHKLATLVERASFYPEVSAGSNPLGGNIFPLLLFYFHIQMFCYTIMNIFIALLENVKKSRTSTGEVSL
jgi:hypothetical protein